MCQNSGARTPLLGGYETLSSTYQFLILPLRHALDGFFDGSLEASSDLQIAASSRGLQMSEGRRLAKPQPPTGFLVPRQKGQERFKHSDAQNSLVDFKGEPFLK